MAGTAYFYLGLCNYQLGKLTSDKAKLQEALRVKGSWDKVRQDIQAANARVQTITVDQKRLRDNMRELPKESTLFMKYLKTLEDQEKEMEDLQKSLKTLQGDEAKTQKEEPKFKAPKLGGSSQDPQRPYVRSVLIISDPDPSTLPKNNDKKKKKKAN